MGVLKWYFYGTSSQHDRMARERIERGKGLTKLERALEKVEKRHKKARRR